MPEPGAIGNVVIRPRGLDDGDGKRLGPVDQREMSRRPDVLRQRAQRGQRGLPYERMHLAAQAQHSEPHPGAATQITAYEGVLLQRGEQPVHHGPVDAQFVRELGDGQPVIRVGEQLEDAQSPVERLRGLRGHDAHSLVVRSTAPSRRMRHRVPSATRFRGRRSADDPGSSRAESLHGCAPRRRCHGACA
jgi:hypothetical protein